MGVPRQIVQIYAAKQADKTTAATTPLLTWPVTGGKPFNHTITEDLIELTGTSPGRGVADRTLVVPGLTAPTVAFTKSIGVPLYYVMGGYAVTGAGPYTHTFTAANEPLAYASVWGRYNTDYVRTTGAKCNQLTISWDGAGAVRMESIWLGVSSTWAATPGAATNDDTTIGAPLLRAAGGTFQVDIDGTSVATYCIRSGSITINRNMDSDTCAASVTPDDNTAGVCEITYSLTIVPASTLVDVRNIVTGTPTATTIASAPVYGAVNLQFTDGTSTLTLTSNRVNYMAETPDADPGGGSATVVLAGRALAGSGVQQLSAVLVNTIATYAA